MVNGFLGSRRNMGPAKHLSACPRPLTPGNTGSRVPLCKQIGSMLLTLCFEKPVLRQKFAKQHIGTISGSCSHRGPDIQMEKKQYAQPLRPNAQLMPMLYSPAEHSINAHVEVPVISDQTNRELRLTGHGGIGSKHHRYRVCRHESRLCAVAACY